MTRTVVALAALLLPLMLGALACDDNSGALPCLPAAGASSDTARGVAFSSAAAEACVQGAAEAAVSSGTVSGKDGSDSGSNSMTSGTAPGRRRRGQ